MDNNEELTGVLNDLLMLNNDRIEIYRRAIRKIGEHDLKVIFLGAIEESKKIQSILSMEIFKRDRLPDVEGTSTEGKLNQFWLDVKVFFNVHDQDTMRRACGFSEYCVQKAYTDALNHDKVSGELSQILNNQVAALRKSHETLKIYSLSY